MTMTHFLADGGRRRQDSPEETAGLEDGEDLPLSPEEDSPVIPDEERVLEVPS
jgi:hypothetical protein